MVKLIIPEGGGLFKTSSMFLIWLSFSHRIQLRLLIVKKRSVSLPSFYSIARELLRPAKRGIQEVAISKRLASE